MSAWPKLGKTLFGLPQSLTLNQQAYETLEELIQALYGGNTAKNAPLKVTS